MVLIAVLAYLAAAAVLVRGIARGNRPGSLWLLPALAGIALHAAWHVAAWRGAGVADLHFFAALSLVGLGMAALTALYGATGRMAALGVIVFPLAAAMLAADAAVAYEPSPAMGWPLQLHAWTALLAYATLAVAAVLAVLLWVQERRCAGANCMRGCARCRRWWSWSRCCSARSRQASSCCRRPC
jgi:ABC-type uncharacterized transport system permease subunit